MKKSAFIISAVIGTVTLLSGCLIPERFTAKIDFQPDANYTFHYSGTAVHALAAAEIKKKGSLSEKDENGLKSDAEKLSKKPDIQKAIYKGNGRYELEIESAKKAGQPLRALDIFSVKTGKDGVVTISSNEIKDKDKRELEQLGIAINGVLEVRLPKNANVISHNATTTPTLGIGSYSWKIGRIDQRPMMKVQFNP
ncbi:hypothetical protein [Chitinibacter sp. GC72]|uniref:hypothetical protein n=1 Tax=Chitinibacter sp. GC72 TaxID=1526917 RepID=UPI0012FC029F|nr:hypothetical protein [Chitinibacter sp. GC72]